MATTGLAQKPAEKKSEDKTEAAGETEAAATIPEKVEVKPVARDDEIADRLHRILDATDWFRDPNVSVREGVVFLKGRTANEQFKKWAGDLGRNTRDVVAVVNQIDVDTPPIWDSTEVHTQLTELGRSSVRGLPVFVFALVVLSVAFIVSRLLSRLVRRLLKRSMQSDLLRKVTAKGIGLLVFLLAVYLVLQVSGLTRLALTLAGGTGVLGLALGIAFKEITENFLASIYLSIQKPFEIGDLVEVNGTQGYVQRVTARTTLLMAPEGNHIQIPNATVFKNTLRNYTSNSNRRVDFVVGVGYNAAITDAQSVGLQVLIEHPAVLDDPEPWVLVDNLGISSVNLRFYFWLDCKEHSWLKVRSAVIRLVKSAFQQAGISFHDEFREVSVGDGVSVRLGQLTGVGNERSGNSPGTSRTKVSDATPVSSEAEGGLTSEAGEIEEQARHSRIPEGGDNLLANKSKRESEESDKTLAEKKHKT